MHSKSYRHEWAVKAQRSERDVYIPRALRPPTREALSGLVEAIREDGDLSGGAVQLGGVRTDLNDTLLVSLPRFQSYRARTQAALLFELLEFVGDASEVRWSFDDNASLVVLEV